jgi:hypothetical protein
VRARVRLAHARGAADAAPPATGANWVEGGEPSAAAPEQGLLVIIVAGERMTLPAGAALAHPGSLLAEMCSEVPAATAPSGAARALAGGHVVLQEDGASWAVATREPGAVRAMLRVVQAGPDALPRGDFAALKALYDEAAWWRLPTLRDAVRQLVLLS